VIPPAARLKPAAPRKSAVRHESGGMLLDAISEIELFVYVFSTVYVIVLFAYVLTSWVRLPYSLQPIQRFLYDVGEPYLRLWRRILPSFGPIDLSPMVGIISVVVVQQILIAILSHL
jgi:YggT family protein